MTLYRIDTIHWAQENCIKSEILSEYFKTFENIPEGI